MSDDDQPEFDDSGSPKKLIEELRRLFETQLANMPKPSVSFVISRAELLHHLEERAEHHRLDAMMLANGERDLRPDEMPMVVPTPRPGDPPEDLRAHFRKHAIRTAREKGSAFAFFAQHLAEIEHFTLDLYTANTYELVAFGGSGPSLGY